MLHRDAPRYSDSRCRTTASPCVLPVCRDALVLPVCRDALVLTVCCDGMCVL